MKPSRQAEVPAPSTPAPEHLPPGQTLPASSDPPKPRPTRTHTRSKGRPSPSTPPESPSDQPSLSPLSPLSPSVSAAATEASTETPPPLSGNGEEEGAAGAGAVYITVLLDNHPVGSRRPSGTRREVRARLLKRNPKTVVVRLPGGKVIERRIKRDVVRGLEAEIKGGVLWEGARQ